MPWDLHKLFLVAENIPSAKSQDSRPDRHIGAHDSVEEEWRAEVL